MESPLCNWPNNAVVEHFKLGENEKRVIIPGLVVNEAHNERGGVRDNWERSDLKTCGALSRNAGDAGSTESRLQAGFSVLHKPRQRTSREICTHIITFFCIFALFSSSSGFQ